MNIVVLDGFTLNPGDLSWNALSALGPCEVHERTPCDQVQHRASTAEIVLTNKTPLDREQIERLPRLRYIGILATGANIIDLAAARERNIPVTNVPAYGTKSVAQTTLALLLELTQHVGHHSESVRSGGWTRSPDWCYWDHPLIELDGLRLGIVGFGRIGQAVARLGAAFGMSVAAFGRRPDLTRGDVEYLDLEPLLRGSDVVSLHCPLTPETRHIVNAQTLSFMKPSALLLNTSRGPLIDEPALANALNSGQLAGAGLDVLSSEPPPENNPLLTARNCIITPHLAWGTLAARSRLMQIAVENVRAFLSGKPINVVN